jgi:hypothetical protein
MSTGGYSRDPADGSARLPEQVVALGQEVAIRFAVVCAWHVDSPILKSIGPSTSSKTSSRTLTSRLGVTPMS